MTRKNRGRAAGVLLAGLCILGAAALTRAQAGDLGYKVVENWGPLPSGQPWGETTGIVLGPTGNLIALRRSDPPLVEIDPSGKVLKTWGDGMFVWPHGLRLDREGFLWVTDGRTGTGRGQQIFKIAPDGRVVLTLGKAGVAGETPETFNGPCDVAFGNNGDIFVADGHQGSRVVKLTKDGRFIKAWGTRGAAPGQFNVPHAIAIDSRGRVFVADRGNARLQIFDQDGTFLDQWPQFGRPSGILIAPDDTLYVADVNDKRGIVVGSAKDGSVRGVISGTLPEAVAVDRAGAVYGAETTTGRTLRKLVKN